MKILIAVIIVAIVAFIDPPIVYSIPLQPEEIVVYDPYPWADENWIHHAASIVSGETVNDCPECDLWIACTIVGDVAHRKYHRYGLHPGRWHGMKRPQLRHYEAVVQAARPHGCDEIPTCRYLGNDGDYRYWRSIGLVGNKEVRVLGGSRSSIYCIPPN